MNMKKTIAAIAAGAVAVSAMATTVSALESGTLNYNLVNTLANQKNGKLTLKATFPNVKLVSGTDVTVLAVGMGWNDKVVVSGQYIDTNKAIAPITFTRDIWSEGYSAATEAMIGVDNTITIPVRAVNDGSPALIGGTATDAVPGTPAVDPVKAASEVTAKSANITAEVGDIKVQTAAFDGMADGTYTIKYDVDKWVILDAEGFSTGKVILVNGATGEADGETLTVKYTAPVAGKPEVPGTPATEGGQMANITVTVSMKTIDDKDWETVNKKIQSGVYGIKFNGVYGDATGSAFTAPTKFKAPLMSQVTDNTNIITYLQNANTNGDDKGYKNVGAVLNDAIENFETVTFTFNTAAANVRFAAATGTKTAPVINNDNINKNYNDTLKKLKDGEFIVGLYAENDWEGVDTYKAFGDHTYDWYYSPEGTGMVGMDWGGQNLFAGALIINEGLTMSLSNTEYFDWTKTSISFDWDSIMDGAATTNNYATYIHSMKLATSNMWFWDSMDVVLVAGESDDVSADAGVEADDETLDDNEADDEIVADDDDDEPVADDEDEEPAAPVVDEEPAPVVTNPPTGNASVALAVIPVALAAAAIVAKKRG